MSNIEELEKRANKRITKKLIILLKGGNIKLEQVFTDLTWELGSIQVWENIFKKHIILIHKPKYI